MKNVFKFLVFALIVLGLNGCFISPDGGPGPRHDKRIDKKPDRHSHRPGR